MAKRDNTEIEGVTQLITKIFQKFDTNRDGKLDSYQFGNLLSHLSYIVTKSRVKSKKVDQLMTLCDTDGDGYIVKEQFQLFRDVIIEQVKQMFRFKPVQTKKMLYQLHSLNYNL